MPLLSKFVVLMLPFCSGLTLAAVPSANASDQEYVTSDQHYAALKAKAGNPKPLDRNNRGWNKLPNWSGIWRSGNKANFDGVHDFITEPTSAPLNGEYAQQYQKTLDSAKKGIKSDIATSCMPVGFPRMQVEPYLKEFILTPDRVMLMAEMLNETRKIYTDGRPHIPEDEAYPLYEGDSIGFWNHDTLVVHTNHLRADAKGYQREGPPQSDQISTVEQIRKVGEEIIDQMTVYDPAALTRPWRVVHKFIRVDTPHPRLDYWECEQSNRWAITPEGGTIYIGPSGGK